MTQDSTHAVAVIVAGGQGLRMQNAVPKQFLPLNGKPILYYSIKAFMEAVPGIRIVLVLPNAHFSYANSVLQHFTSGIDITIVEGGASRFESVKNGLKETRETDIIFVHDGVRPLLSTQLIATCLEAAKAYGNAIPVVPVTDSIRQITGDNDSNTVDRELLRAVQTPQTFQGSVLLPAFEQAYRESFTDEASVVEQFGIKVHLVAGEKSNLKITTPEDILFAAAIQTAQDDV
ncbi:MAG: 2-C-methyl-D-erythritol 4-phosphate cytidylyltransferase [Bacteroidetes bacterium 43-16]|nr:MAG: 2-C-methyl-D-erythritol 4-phosphate cytidylyltransferase [Bacteroidetes bacterium 43-16]